MTKNLPIFLATLLVSVFVPVSVSVSVSAAVENASVSAAAAENVRAIHFTKKYELNVYNLLPDKVSSLTLTCRSKDDDLGTQILYYNQFKRWTFRLSFFGKTRFTCFFMWNEYKKTNEFDVFEDVWGYKCETSSGNVCTWIVAAEGFYFTPHSPVNPKQTFTPNLEKKYTWE